MAEKVTDGVNGFHFRVGDPASLAEVIRHAVESPATWERMREGIPQVFKLHDQVSQLGALYSELRLRANVTEHEDAAATVSSMVSGTLTRPAVG